MESRRDGHKDDLGRRSLSIRCMSGRMSPAKLAVVGASGVVVILALIAVIDDWPHYPFLVVAAAVVVIVDISINMRSLASSMGTMKSWQIPALWAPLGFGTFLLVFFTWGFLPAILIGLVVGGVCPGIHRYLRDRRALRQPARH